MIQQDIEVVFPGQRQAEMAKKLGSDVITLGKDVVVVDNPSKIPSFQCAFHLKEAKHLDEAIRRKTVRYIFGFHELQPHPLMNQVHAKLMRDNDITLLLPYPFPSSTYWASWVHMILPIFEKYKVQMRFVCLSDEPLRMRGCYEKESYYRLVLNQ